MAANLWQNPEESNDWRPKRSSFSDSRSSQEVFESMNRELLPKLADITSRAFDMARNDYSADPPHFRVPLSKSVKVQERWQGLLLEELGDDMKFDKNRFYLEVNGYRFFFKKLRRDLKPMNNPTSNSKSLLIQLDSDVVNVFVGYIPCSHWEELKTLCVVYICNNSIVWVTDLKPFRSDGPTQLPIFPVEPDNVDGGGAENDGLIVTPKRRDKRAMNGTGSSE